MMEYMLVRDMLRNIEVAARGQHALRVVNVHLGVGLLSSATPDELRRNFEQLAPGTIAERARLDIDVCNDPCDPLACEVVLRSIQVEVRNEPALAGAALYND